MQPKEVINIKRQSGKQPKMVWDQQLLALFPGKRISKSGKEYWETRRNRTDLNKQSKI